ncbi:MAG: HD-GYP domain-containing protein [Eubacteriales bacterium]|nr:HD-GYP domain-containing protein [Eubacteriales bacterium]
MLSSKKLFSKPTLILTAAGLAVNIALVWLTGVLKIPLYLDSIGTVAAAALGGVLPGIAVGFLSNCVTALAAVSPDPMTLYYGFLNVLIAVVTAWLSKAGLLRRWYGRVLLLASLTAIGGALGSLVTWMLYGFSFGQGASAALAHALFERLHLNEFSAQLTADLGTDLLDKLITVAALCALLRLLPAPVMNALPLGEIYRDRKALPDLAQLREKGAAQLQEEMRLRKHSVHTKITALILVSTSILSVVAITIGIGTYRAKLIARYSELCEDAAAMMLPKLDGDRVEDYLALGESAPGYEQTRQELYDILHNARAVRYMYVYSIQPDGCHVVFDLDVDGLPGAPVGSVGSFDAAFPYLEEGLAGEEIPTFVTNGSYGWLLTAYRPVYDSAGRVAAYAAVDVDMNDLTTHIYTYFINIASLLFGVMIVIATFSLWYCDRKLLEPMNVLAEQARDFDFDGTHRGRRVRDRHTVQTGDELEEIFHAMCLTEDAIAQRVETLNEKNLEISQMQRNIIYTLASMVENRDANTGGHIRRTASYVRLIGQKLREAGLYADIVDEDYVKRLYDSAPLHDIGKIKVPDAILNKAGHLTDAEFERMKNHTREGRDILRASLSGIEDDAWLSMAIDMAGCHHERWDGTGYPEGLRGEQIPLCARIMAVSDVFDALVSARSYKSGFSFDDAMRVITSESGTHFDPVIVDVFAHAPDEVRRIMEA